MLNQIPTSISPHDLTDKLRREGFTVNRYVKSGYWTAEKDNTMITIHNDYTFEITSLHKDSQAEAKALETLQAVIDKMISKPNKQIDLMLW